MKLLILAAASLAVVSCASLSLEDLEFHAWKLKFGKVYRTPEEEARRKDIWLSTRRRVLAHNILADQGIKTYRMGMNHLSDMDMKEYYTALNGSRLHLDFMKSTHRCDITDFKSGAQLPGSVDWRDKGCVTPVKDQGQSCGSCWAFSAVGALESHTCIKHKRLTALSEQQLVDCAKKHGCNSGTALDAFGYCMKSQGIVKEKDYPYKGEESPCPYTKNKIPSKKIGAKCTGCYRIDDEQSLQQEVAEKGPVSVTVVSLASLQSYECGVYDEPECARIAEKDREYHSMLVVGYGTTTKGEDYWLVKNSYGTQWGEAGYIRMARNKNNCDIATYAFYPVVK